jgi:hypothetical protein
MRRSRSITQPYVVEYTHALPWTESYELVYYINDGKWKKKHIPNFAEDYSRTATNLLSSRIGRSGKTWRIS